MRPFDPDPYARDADDRRTAPAKGVSGAAFWAALLLVGLIVITALTGRAPDLGGGQNAVPAAPVQRE